MIGRKKEKKENIAPVSSKYPSHNLHIFIYITYRQSDKASIPVSVSGHLTFFFFFVFFVSYVSIESFFSNFIAA